MYKCCAKKNGKKKKKSIPPVKTAGMKKKLKKKLSNHVAVTVGHVSRSHSIPPFETAGMKKKTKKKLKVGHFEKKISNGVKLEIFFANGVRKKKNFTQLFMYLLY